MALVSLQGVNVGFGGPLLLEGVDLSIDRGERVCLVGRNGTGKSTILRLITGEVKPDGGKIVFQQGVRITLLTQEVPNDLTGSVFDVVSGAFGEQGKLLAAYHHVSARLAHALSLVEGPEAVAALLEPVQLHARLPRFARRPHVAWRVQRPRHHAPNEERGDAAL